MAHVLLPCDLPTWNDVQRHLAQLKLAKDSKQLIQGMIKIYEICNISLEPEDLHQNKKQDYGPIFEKFEKFLNENLSDEERRNFFDEILPNLVTQALCLHLSKPQNGFLYSLKREDENFQLDRGYVMSVLANGFFSTFPRRTPKTHPFLQNFAFSDFFQHLHRRSQQKKLKAFFRYFDKCEGKKYGSVFFQRKTLKSTSIPSLPGWLCSDRALIPLIIRHEGNIHDTEPNVWRAFQCCSLIGGDVLQSATSPESSLFFAFPELLCCLSFIEKLEDNEALVVHGVIPFGIRKKRHSCTNAVSICLMDGMVDFELDCDKQFEDSSLLRELNKALITFDQSNNDKLIPDELIRESQRRQTPVGESSSSEQPSTCSSRRTSTHRDRESILKNEQNRKYNSQDEEIMQHMKGKRIPTEYEKHHSTRPSRSEDNSLIRATKDNDVSIKTLSDITKALGASSIASFRPQSLLASASSSRSSTRSMKTASESSLEPLTKSHVLSVVKCIGGEDEYYTADEDSDKDSSDCALNMRKNSNNTCGSNLSSLLKFTSPLVEEVSRTQNPVVKSCRRLSNKGSASEDSDLSHCESTSRRSESLGFVLGGTVSDEDIDDFAIEDEERLESSQCQPHERLEDFRKRIRRRTRRHLSRKMRSSSRSSYSLGSSTSSDMEDISEEEDNFFPHGVIRPSNSEPSLCTLTSKQGTMTLSPFGGGLVPIAPTADTVVVSVGGRKVLITSSNGQLKAYSYDGVNPNLPVPFRARFRTRHYRSANTNHSSDINDNSYWSPIQQKLETNLCLSASMSDSDDEKISPTKHLSDISSLPSVDSSQRRKVLQENIIDNPHNLHTETKANMHSVAVGPSKYGDPQLRALVLWLAASMSGIPSLIFYTGQEPKLQEFNAVHHKVLSRQWTVGDLSCEILRFCRNKLSPRKQLCATSLFDQFFSSGAISVASSVSYSQHSLD